MPGLEVGGWPPRWRDESSSSHSPFVTQEVESGTGIGRVLHLHSDAALPHGSQHPGLQPFGPVTSAHHNNLGGSSIQKRDRLSSVISWWDPTFHCTTEGGSSAQGPSTRFPLTVKPRLL